MLDNYSDRPVPESEQVSGVRLAIVIIGIAITIPAFLIAGEVFGGLGLRNGLIAVSIGGVIVATVAILTMSIAARTQLSTYALVQRPFGVRGGQIISVVMTITLLGWYGVTAQLFGKAIVAAANQAFGSELVEWPMTLLGSVLMAMTAIYGFSAIERLSRYVVPVLLVVLAVAAWRVAPAIWAGEGSAIADEHSIRTIAMGVSAVVGGFMVAVTIAPDVARFASSTGQASFAAVASYGFGYVLVLTFAGLPGLVVGSVSYIDGLIALGMGTPAMIVVVFATWTTNTNNLYSASLSSSRLFPRVSDWMHTVVLGVLGTVFALLGLADNLVPFLIALSIAIPPISGIYIVHYLMVDHKDSPQGINSLSAWGHTAILAWLIAILGSWFAVQAELRLTGIAALDSLFIGVATYFILHRLRISIAR